MWQCSNPEGRDFRIEVTDKTWTSSRLLPEGKGKYVGRVPEPAKGWTAFMVELTYPETAKRSRKVKLGGRLGQARDTIGIPYKFTTGVHVLPEKMPFEFKLSPIPNR